MSLFEVTPVEGDAALPSEVATCFRVLLRTDDGRTCSYDLTGTDVVEALDWAERRADASHSYAVAVVVGQAGAQGSRLVWLVAPDTDGPTGY